MARNTVKFKGFATKKYNRLLEYYRPNNLFKKLKENMFPKSC